MVAVHAQHAEYGDRLFREGDVYRVAAVGEAPPVRGALVKGDVHFVLGQYDDSFLGLFVYDGLYVCLELFPRFGRCRVLWHGPGLCVCAPNLIQYAVQVAPPCILCQTSCAACPV